MAPFETIYSSEFLVYFQGDNFAELLMSVENVCGSGDKLFISVSHTTDYVVPNSTYN